MRTLPGTRTLDLWSTFLRMTSLEPLTRIGGGGMLLSASPARRRRIVPLPQTEAWTAPCSAGAPEPAPAVERATDAGEAHRELRMRLVEEYARRLDMVRAVLAPLRDAWSAEAVARADRLASELAAWERHLRAVPGSAPEPSPDLQTLGSGVLDLLGRASTHLAWSDPTGAGRGPGDPRGTGG